MNRERLFSSVNILVFSFQCHSQLNHFTWEMISAFIFSDWLMSPGCCQIRLCHPIFPTTRPATSSKCAEWKQANPLQLGRRKASSWAEWKIRSWMHGFRKQIHKMPTWLKSLANQSQCCSTVLIIFVPATYATYHNLIIFFNGNRLIATRNILHTKIKRNLLA